LLFSITFWAGITTFSGISKAALAGTSNSSEETFAISAPFKTILIPSEEIAPPTSFGFLKKSHCF
jgi:hypothetical protein